MEEIQYFMLIAHSLHKQQQNYKKVVFKVSGKLQ